MAGGDGIVDVKVEEEDWEVMSEPEVEELPSRPAQPELRARAEAWKRKKMNLESGQRHTLDINLIEEVKKYPVIYDPMHPQNRDPFLKEKIWRQIGQTICVSPDYCKLRWKSIRDRFVKTEKQERQIRESGLKIMSKPYRFAASLSFLRDFMRIKNNRFTHTHIEDNEDDIVTQDSQSDKDNADDSSASDYGWTSQNMASPNTMQRSSTLDGSEKQLHMNIEPVSSTPITNGMSHARLSTGRQRMQEPANEHPVVNYYDIPSPSDSRNLAGNHSSMTSGHSTPHSLSMPPSLTPGHPPAMKTERELSFDGDTGNDDVTYFLMSLAPALRRLSTEKQSLAKIKMQTLLHEIEFS